MEISSLGYFFFPCSCGHLYCQGASLDGFSAFGCTPRVFPDVGRLMEEFPSILFKWKQAVMSRHLSAGNPFFPGRPRGCSARAREAPGAGLDPARVNTTLLWASTSAYRHLAANGYSLVTALLFAFSCCRRCPSGLNINETICSLLCKLKIFSTRHTVLFPFQPSLISLNQLCCWKVKLMYDFSV